ncbi:MAG: ABC transporter permease [Bacilli bacterium]|nr:ABC transporter permease [Bacilli bacterium]
MKKSDFIRLGKYSLKNNKTQTANTVRGIAFGATLLITLLFVLLAFYQGTMAKILQEKSISSFRLEYDLLMDDQDLNEEIKAEILSEPAIKNSIIYQQIYLSYSEDNHERRFPKFTIAGVDYLYDYDYRVDLEKSSDWLHFFDTANSTTLITEEEEAYLRNNNYGKALLAGSLFTQNIEEVVISSQVVDYFNIDYLDVIGKELSYEISLPFYNNAYDKSNLKYSNLEGDIKIINNYKIVGVFNSNLYLSPTRGEHLSYCPSLWLKKEAIYNNDISFYLKGEDIKGFIYQKDPLEVFNDAIEQKKVAIPYGFNYLLGFGDLRSIDDFRQYIQFEDFKSAYDYSKVLNNYAEKYQQFHFDDNTVFSNYEQFYPLIMLVSITFLIFGGVVFFATVLNLYNTMRYSLEKRKSFLAMCKAMGMTKNDIIKLYFSEIALLLLRSVFWITLFTFSLSLLITLSFNNMLVDSSIETIISYKFNFIYYLIVLIPSLIIILLIALVISLLIGKQESKSNLVSRLNEN